MPQVKCHNLSLRVTSFTCSSWVLFWNRYNWSGESSETGKSGEAGEPNQFCEWVDSGESGTTGKSDEFDQLGETSESVGILTCQSRITSRVSCGDKNLNTYRLKKFNLSDIGSVLHQPCAVPGTFYQWAQNAFHFGILPW